MEGAWINGGCMNEWKVHGLMEGAWMNGRCIDEWKVHG